MSDTQWFVQGECNCVRCVDKRKVAMSTKLLDKIKEDLPFIPWNLNPEKGFNGKAFKTKDEYEDAVKAMYIRNDMAKTAAQARGISKSRMRYCMYCGTYHEMDASRQTKDGKAVRYICEDCMGEYYFRCNNCMTLHKKGGTEVEVKGALYCHDCAKKLFHKCFYCGGFKADDERMDLSGEPQWEGIFVCVPCGEKHFALCADCGGLFDKRSMRHIDDTEDLYCNECQERLKVIKSFDYKPRPKFCVRNTEGARREDTITFGVELEVELYGSSRKELNRDWVGKKVIDLMGDDFYNKHDGSLRDGGALGFEIVSHPFTWQHYRNSMRKQWNACFEMLKGYGCRSYQSGRCGMHVHINKKAFTKHHTYKFVDFVYNPAHLPFIVSMSGRGEYDHRFRSYASLDGYHDIKKYVKNDMGHGHHSAIDLCPKQTTELRIFRGTLTPSLFHKNMEFTHALFFFTKRTSRARNSALHFVKWVCSPRQRGMYRDLVKYIKADKRMQEQYGLAYMLREMGV